MERVRERAGAQLTTQKDMATDGIGTVARAMRNTTEELRGQRHETLAEYVERAADQLDRLSSGLKNKDVGDLFREAQQLARRQPVFFVGSAFAIGLLAARFLKSSAPRRAHQHAWQRTQPAATGSSPYQSQHQLHTSTYENAAVDVPSSPPFPARSAAPTQRTEDDLPSGTGRRRQAGRGSATERR